MFTAANRAIMDVRLLRLFIHDSEWLQTDYWLGWNEGEVVGYWLNEIVCWWITGRSHWARSLVEWTGKGQRWESRERWSQWSSHCFKNFAFVNCGRAGSSVRGLVVDMGVQEWQWTLSFSTVNWVTDKSGHKLQKKTAVQDGGCPSAGTPSILDN
jgi:hypothetical protein